MIRIENYKPIQRGCVVAEMDVIIEAWHLTIRKIQECMKGDNRWFNFPAFCEDETKVWKSYIEFTANKDKFLASVRDKVDKLLEENPDIAPKPVNFSEEVPF